MNAHRHEPASVPLLILILILEKRLKLRTGGHFSRDDELLAEAVNLDLLEDTRTLVD